MSICPKCKEEIEELNNYVSGENHYKFSLVECSLGDYNEVEFQEDGKVNDYECPNCKEILFTDEEEAIEFLENKDELQRIVKEKINKINKEKKYGK